MSFVAIKKVAVSFKEILKTAIALFCLIFIQCHSFAQDLDKLYKDSTRSRDAQKADEEEKKKKYQEFFDAARKNGTTWKCKDYFIFHNGYVFVGNKADGSDIGKKPYDIVGTYSTNKEFVKFNFPALPYENQFELNTKTNEMVSYKKTLNKLDKDSCQKLSK